MGIAERMTAAVVLLIAREPIVDHRACDMRQHVEGIHAGLAPLARDAVERLRSRRGYMQPEEPAVDVHPRLIGMDDRALGQFLLDPLTGRCQALGPLPHDLSQRAR